MDKPLKQRMVGAIVLIALAVIFIPMLLDGGNQESQRSVSLDIPAKPDQKYRSRLLPLDERQGDAAQAQEAEEVAERARGPVQRDQQVQEPAPGPAADDPESESQAAAGPEQSQTRPADEPEESNQVAAQVAAEDAPGAEGDEGAAPATEASGDGALVNWFVQVGSFSREENATDLRDRLRQAGYTAFTETSTVEGTTTHRVKVGPEMDKPRAEKIRDEIQNGFDLRGIVVSEP